MRRMSWIAAALVIVLASAAACSPKKVDITPSSLPSSSLTPSGTPSVLIPISPGSKPTPTDGTDGSPQPATASPVSFQGEGTTTIKGPGGMNIELNFDSMDSYSYYGGNKGESGLTFMDGANTLSLGGTLKKGTQKTSAVVGLTLFVPASDGNDLVSFTSGDGACIINLVEAAEQKFSGTFRCPHAKVEDGTFIDVAGTFSGNLAGASAASPSP